MKKTIYLFLIIGILVQCDSTTSSDVEDPGKSNGLPNENSFEYGTVIDKDGNDYRTIEIGNQIWMADNLKVTKYSDGSEIPSTTIADEDSWYDTTDGLFLNVADSIVDMYGIQYSWYATNDERGLCPKGWRIPSNTDWKELIDYLIDEFGITNVHDDENGVGNYLKSCRQKDSPLGGNCDTDERPRWVTVDQELQMGPNPHYGRNKVGFGAVPTGRWNAFRYHNFMDTQTYNAYIGGVLASWWSSDEESDTRANVWNLDYQRGDLKKTYYSKQNASAVRCILD